MGDRTMTDALDRRRFLGVTAVIGLAAARPLMPSRNRSLRLDRFRRSLPTRRSSST